MGSWSFGIWKVLLYFITYKYLQFITIAVCIGIRVIFFWIQSSGLESRWLTCVASLFLLNQTFEGIVDILCILPKEFISASSLWVKIVWILAKHFLIFDDNKKIPIGLLVGPRTTKSRPPTRPPSVATPSTILISNWRLSGSKMANSLTSRLSRDSSSLPISRWPSPKLPSSTQERTLVSHSLILTRLRPAQL
jgi:hypothetical protein